MHTGIDLGLGCTALVTLDDKGTVLCKKHFGSKYNDPFKYALKIPHPERLQMYRDAVHKYFVDNKITGIVVIETPAGHIVGHERQLLELYGIYAVVAADFVKASDVYLLSPTEIKLAHTGDGAADKELMMEVCKQRGFHVAHDHEGDATAMALISLDGKMPGIFKHREELEAKKKARKKRKAANKKPLGG